MNVAWVQEQCLTLPHTTEVVQWGDHLVFKVGRKMYAVTSLSPGGNAMSFKCSPEQFAELVECAGVVPAPYLARAHWVALETFDALPPVEIKKHLRNAYDLVFAKLPAKTRKGLNAGLQGSNP